MADETTKEELAEEARELDIEGRSTMDKAELSAAVKAEKKPKRKRTTKATGKSQSTEKSAAGTSVADQKRADAQKRLEEKRKAGGQFGLDAHDPLVGWDVQQGRVRPVAD